MTGLFGIISNKTLLFLLVILLIAACKKKDKYQECTHCQCFDYNKAVAYKDTLIDSAAFFQDILDAWYVKEYDTFGNYSCTNRCFCDASFPVTIIDGKALSITLPDNTKDTISYTFKIYSGKVDPTTGTFVVPASLSVDGLVLMQYNNGYLLITTQTLTPGTLTFPPNYVLAR